MPASTSAVTVPALFRQPEFLGESLPAARTLAGRSDTLFRRSSLAPQRPAPVPVWRRGYKDGHGHKALFNQPTGLAVDIRGRLLVADTLNHCIRRVTHGGRVKTWSLKKHDLKQPTGLVMAPEDHLMVVDQGHQSIKVIDAQKNSLTLLAQLPLLGGIAYHGDWIYVTARHQQRTAILRIHRETGKNQLLAHWENQNQWLDYRTDDEERPFSRWWQGRQSYPVPHVISHGPQQGLGLCVHGDQLIWLEGLRVQRLRLSTGQLQTQSFDLPLWPAPRWQGIAMSHDGTLYAIDAEHHQVYAISEQGVKLAAEVPHGLANPYGIARNAYGQLFISDTGHWRICRFNLSGNSTLLRLARLAYLPYFKKGTTAVAKRHSPASAPAASVSVAQSYALDVLERGKQAQQLQCVKELTETLAAPVAVEGLLQTRPLLSAMLSHESVAVRSLLIQKMGDTIHEEGHALVWIELFEQFAESNRLLKKYRLEMLQYLGKRYQLYGHVVPLMVKYVHAEEEDVVEFAFEHLMKVRNAGYASLVDPLIEALRQ